MEQNSYATRLEAEKAAIQNCEKDLIHTIEFIQPAGYLLACDPKTRQVTHASENLSQLFPMPLTAILASALDDVLPAEVVHQVNNAAGHSTITRQREHVGRYESVAGPKDIFVHMKQARLILEFQPVSIAPEGGLKMLDGVQRLLERLGQQSSVQALMQTAVEALRALTGFHRVKTYQFLSDGAGEVIAESAEPQVDSFLGLRFPAFDVPQSARALYASTPIRIIPQVDAEQVPIVASGQEPPLDLSLALFRAVVPVHVMYLENMGVKATLSVPIVVEGQMWGLFAFHHMAPHMLESEVLSALEILGGSISMMLDTLLQRQRLKRMEECTRLVSSLFVPDETALGFTAYWDTAGSELATLLHCDGVGLLSEGRFDHYGLCPQAGLVRQLANRITDEYSADKPIAIDSIRAKYPEIVGPEIERGDIAGVLAIPNPALSYSYLMFFRRGASRAVRWAGAPSKNLTQAEGGFRLNPRASFTEYVDSAHHRSDAFSDDDMIVAQALSDALSRLMSTVSTHSQHRERLGLVIRELNHRVRNILALVGSIVSQSGSASHDLESFIAALERRIQALAETHKLLTEFEWEPVQIGELLKRTLAPYQPLFNTRIIFQGAGVSLPPELASLLALVVHELASNAAKYGALSNSQGRVSLTWHVAEQGLALHWQEQDGPVVRPPGRQGFGTTLIKEALAYEFDADCQLAFAEAGLSAQFFIPNVCPMGAKPLSVAEDGDSAPVPKPFRALVLEDDYVIASEVARMLKALGAVSVDTAPTLKRARECLAKGGYDFALLDANIRGEFSGAIAKQLQQAGIPFAFATGYGSKDQQLRSTACVDVLSKPISELEVLAVLNTAKVI